MRADGPRQVSAIAKFMAMLSPGARVAAVVLIFLLMAALFAPWVAPYGENEIVGEFWEPFSARSWLGTDQLGACGKRFPEFADHYGCRTQSRVPGRGRRSGGDYFCLSGHGPVAG